MTVRRSADSARALVIAGVDIRVSEAGGIGGGGAKKHATVSLGKKCHRPAGLAATGADPPSFALGTNLA